MTLFNSKEWSAMFAEAQNGTLETFSKALGEVSDKEINNNRRVRRACGGLDNGTYTIRVSALGVVYLDRGNSDFAALLVERGAKVETYMARRLLGDIKYDRLTSYRKEETQPLTANEENLISILSKAGIDWDKVKLYDYDNPNISAAVWVERTFGASTRERLGMGSPTPSNVKIPEAGEPTRRLLGRK